MLSTVMALLKNKFYLFNPKAMFCLENLNTKFFDLENQNFSCWACINSEKVDTFFQHELYWWMDMHAHTHSQK